MKRLLLILLLLTPAQAQVFAPVPYVFQANTPANASQVMADFTSVVSNGNAVGNFLASQIAIVTPPPPGSVMFFYLASCPSGWTLQSAWNNLFIRGLDLGAGNDPGNTLAAIEVEGIQTHTHAGVIYATGPSFTGITTGGTSGVYSTGVFTINDPQTGVAGGSAGDTMEPANVTLKLCKKN